MSAELLRALNTRSLSAEDRLKVACYLWKQEGPQLSANKAVLAKWIGDEICSAYGKKVRCVCYGTAMPSTTSGLNLEPYQFLPELLGMILCESVCEARLSGGWLQFSEDMAALCFVVCFRIGNGLIYRL